MELRKQGAKLRKRERVVTFLTHKNKLPFFFLWTKYCPKVNTISRQYDKREQQSFLFRDIRGKREITQWYM